MAEELTTTIYFAWKSVMPDRRQWKPSSPILELDDTSVAVVIPLTPEYVFNYDKVVAAELDGKSNLLEPQLTPKGMRYCINKLEEVMSEPELPLEPAEDWGEETKTDNTVSTSSKDDWADGAQFDEGDASKADNELWESNEEDWK